jgi:hypothetical protein
MPAALPKQTQKPLEAWAVTYCTERGFDWEFAKKNGCELVADLGAVMRGYPGHGGILFVSKDPITGERLESGQLRHMNPIHYTEKGRAKERKFSQRKGTPYEPFFAANMNWARAFKDRKIPLILSEGPTRSLAGAKHGFYVIALPGVNGHGTGDELHASLRRIVWKRRKAFVCFDADAIKNPNVQREEQALAKKLLAHGAEVYIVRIPTFIPKAGLDDVLGRGGAGALQLQLDAARPHSGDGDAMPIIECVADVTAREVEWLWYQRLPLAMLSGLEGNPGDGKTCIALDIAAQGSRGRQPYSQAKGKPFNTLYLSYENVTAITTKQRFAAMGGDERRLFVLNGARNPDGTERNITLADVGTIEAAIKETKAWLVIIDPLQSYMGAGVDSHKANETRPLLDALAKVAERQNVCVLIVRHLAKSSGGRAVHKGLGSIDITGAMRSVLMAGTAPDEPQNRALVHTKSNIGPLAESLQFSIEGKNDAAKIVWHGPSDLTAADLAAPDSGKRRETQVGRAQNYLIAALASGPQPVMDLVEGSNGEFSLEVIQKAGKELGVTKSREGESGPWVWAMRQRKFAKGTRAMRAGPKLGKTA